MDFIESQLSIFPKETAKIIILYTFKLNHSIFHHISCNIRKFSNVKCTCNCMFRQIHYDDCTFKIASGAAGPESNIHIYCSTIHTMCMCDTKLPSEIICNACFKTVRQCCGFNCAFCFICECGNGHPYVRMIADM